MRPAHLGRRSNCSSDCLQEGSPGASRPAAWPSAAMPFSCRAVLVVVSLKTAAEPSVVLFRLLPPHASALLLPQDRGRAGPRLPARQLPHHQGHQVCIHKVVSCRAATQWRGPGPCGGGMNTAPNPLHLTDNCWLARRHAPGSTAGTALEPSRQPTLAAAPLVLWLEPLTLDNNVSLPHLFSQVPCGPLRNGRRAASGGAAGGVPAPAAARASRWVLGSAAERMGHGRG